MICLHKVYITSAPSPPPPPPPPHQEAITSNSIHAALQQYYDIIRLQWVTGNHWSSESLRGNVKMLLTFPVISQLKDGTDCWNLPSRTTRTCLTHWGRDKMAAILQKTFSNSFSWIKMYEFQFKFHLSLLLRVQLTIFHHWFRQWLGTNQVPSHYLNQWWLDYQRIYMSLGRNELYCAVTTSLT